MLLKKGKNTEWEYGIFVSEGSLTGRIFRTSTCHVGRISETMLANYSGAGINTRARFLWHLLFMITSRQVQDDAI